MIAARVKGAGRARWRKVAAMFLFAPAVLFAQPSCRALVEYDHDLWTAGQDGRLLKRLTKDGAEKACAALAPDGRSVAYVLVGKQTRTIWLAQVEGGAPSQAEVDNPGVSSILRLGWANQDVLWYDAHGGPQASYFGFWRVSGGDLSKRKELGEDVGVDCALSPQRNDIACAMGYVITLNGKEVARIDMFEGVPKSETQHLAVGQSAVTSGTPSFRIEVRSVSVDAGRRMITLRLYYPEGWAEPVVYDGEMTGGSMDETQFGFAPHFRNGAVDVDVFRREGEPDHFMGPIAWDSSGKRLAALLGSREHSTVVVYARGEGGQWRRTEVVPALGIDEQVVALRYTGGDSQLDITTLTQEFIWDISSKKTILQLPLDLSVGKAGQQTQARVYGWSCSSPGGDEDKDRDGGEHRE